MRLSNVLNAALVASTVSASWMWPGAEEMKAVQEIGAILRRQDSSSASSQATAATTASSSKSTASATASASASGTSAASTGAAASSGSSAAATSGASSGASSTGKTTAKGSGSSGSATTTKKSSTTKTYGNSVGYGGISMLTPDVYSSSSYYKVGDYVTFGWNFTSLSLTPTAIDILATCTANQATYTLAMNQSVTASTMGVTWDTGAYQANATMPLLTETYTLMIHDAARDVTATAAYGGLSAYTQYAFAMYTPQSYTGLSDGWQCVTCSGAMSVAEKQTWGFLFGMVAITIASFSWFTGTWLL